MKTWKKTNLREFLYLDTFQKGKTNRSVVIQRCDKLKNCKNWKNWIDPGFEKKSYSDKEDYVEEVSKTTKINWIATIAKRRFKQILL